MPLVILLILDPVQSYHCTGFGSGRRNDQDIQNGQVLSTWLVYGQRPFPDHRRLKKKKTVFVLLCPFLILVRHRRSYPWFHEMLENHTGILEGLFPWWLGNDSRIFEQQSSLVTIFHDSFRRIFYLFSWICWLQGRVWDHSKPDVPSRVLGIEWSV